MAASRTTSRQSSPRRILGRFAVVASLVAAGSTAQAAPIRYEFGGRITTADPSTGVAPGTRFGGIFTYDPAAEPPVLMIEGSNQYVFAVDPRANKRQIAEAVEKLYEVKVLQVRTQNRMGKIHSMGRFSGRRADWKKAIVTLAEGDAIEVYENL